MKNDKTQDKESQNTCNTTHTATLGDKKTTFSFLSKNGLMCRELSAIRAEESGDKKTISLFPLKNGQNTTWLEISYNPASKAVEMYACEKQVAGNGMSGAARAKVVSDESNADVIIEFDFNKKCINYYKAGKQKDKKLLGLFSKTVNKTLNKILNAKDGICIINKDNFTKLFTEIKDIPTDTVNQPLQTHPVDDNMKKFEKYEKI